VGPTATQAMATAMRDDDLADQGGGGRFSAADRANFYRVLAARRDMRHFMPATHVEAAVFERLLQAAHAAPSVGLMQPWRFVRILDPALRVRIAELVDAERVLTSAALGSRGEDFLQLKVEGIRECAELLVAVLAPDDGTVFGRRTMPRDMALCSIACAIQNLWLAARAENLGLGWVSMFEPDALARVLHLPDGAQPVAVLCLGPVPAFYDAPMLEESGWRQGRPMAEFVYADTWGSAAA
jgi:5,6-dimethylbenzimidazole synthase